MQALVTLSMKGGVGKTTLAIGLARALQRRGLRVGLLDVDIHGSALPRALDADPDPGYEAEHGGKLLPRDVDGFQLFSIGLIFPEGVANMWRGRMEAEAVEQVATLVDWSPDLDWLCVDSPPTSGDETQSLLEHLPGIYGAVVVTQPNDLSILGLEKTLGMMRETGTPVCGVVANMAGYTCPHCGEVSNPFDREAADVEALAAAFGVPYLGSVPFGTEVERAPHVDRILGGILEREPISLSEEQQGGIGRWLLERVLT